MDEFSQILLHFYRHVLRTHPTKSQLINKLYSLLHILNHQQHQRSRPSISSSRSKAEHVLSPRKSDANDLSVRQSGKEWGCSWYLVRPQISKVLSFVILHNLVLTENFWQFQRVREEVKQKLKNTSLIQHTLHKTNLEWDKISKLFFRKKSDIWEHSLLQIFKKMPSEIDNYILQCYNLVQLDSNDSEQLKQSLKHLAFKLKVKIHYFQLESKRIIVNNVYGLSQIQYNVGFVDSLDKFVYANRFPELSEQNRAKLEALQHFQSNLGELLQEYEEGNNKLNEIEGIKSFMQVQAKIKEFINTKK